MTNYRWTNRQDQRLVTDPQKVKQLATVREDENWAFRNWIKLEFGFDDERLMSVVNALTEESTAQIDCTQCANCCRVTTTRVEEEDVEGLADALDLSVPDFRETYLEYVEDEGGYWQLPAPCPLLKGNLCSVYEARPTSCREYPFLHNDFRAHSISRFRNTFICPIVFNVVEEMKYVLRWPQRDRWRR
ncbi:MAG: YkgJ family cysteine cluster protein [Anaerolineae bacterium]